MQVQIGLFGAEFIAGVQILVYVGGVMVLFLFVIMLVNVGAEERGTEEIFNNQRQVTASLIFCFILVGGVLYSVNRGYAGLQSRQTTPPDALAASPVRRLLRRPPRKRSRSCTVRWKARASPVTYY